MFPGFEHPFTCVFAGPTQSGKTFWVKQILKAPHLYIWEPPQRIVWCYGVYSETQIDSIKKFSMLPVEFIEGVPDLDIFSPHERSLLILDDLMAVVGKNKEVAALFTRGCHHKNVSVILLVQNLYHKGPEMRDLHTNSMYVLLLENPRDYSQLEYFARQCFPGWKNYLKKCCMHAWRLPFNPVLIIFKQGLPRNRRVCSGLLPPFRFCWYDPLNMLT
jgi:hypothetical protein